MAEGLKKRERLPVSTAALAHHPSHSTHLPHPPMRSPPCRRRQRVLRQGQARRGHRGVLRGHLPRAPRGRLPHEPRYVPHEARALAARGERHAQCARARGHVDQGALPLGARAHGDGSQPRRRRGAPEARARPVQGGDGLVQGGHLARTPRRAQAEVGRRTREQGCHAAGGGGAGR
eukprot:7172594-Prymnesium_polylepis.1